jgi:hypothetical protein
MPGSTQVWVDGVRQVLVTDYTEDGPARTITFASTPTGVILVRYFSLGG